ncbi:hypothetical protein ACJJTC_004664 [Scirpophaga incertulas]
MMPGWRKIELDRMKSLEVPEVVRSEEDFSKHFSLYSLKEDDGHNEGDALVSKINGIPTWTLAGDDSTATGLCPLTSDDDPALGTGTTRDIFHLSGKIADPTHRLNMCKSGSANTPLQSLIINVGIPSGPADVLDLSRFRAALTSIS